MLYPLHLSLFASCSGVSELILADPAGILCLQNTFSYMSKNMEGCQELESHSGEAAPKLPETHPRSFGVASGFAWAFWQASLLRAATRRRLKTAVILLVA